MKTLLPILFVMLASVAQAQTTDYYRTVSMNAYGATMLECFQNPWVLWAMNSQVAMAQDYVNQDISLSGFHDSFDASYEDPIDSGYWNLVIVLKIRYHGENPPETLGPIPGLDLEDWQPPENN